MADRRGAIMHLSGQALADLVKAPEGTETFGIWGGLDERQRRAIRTRRRAQ